MAIAKDFVFVGRLCLDLVHTGDMGYGRLFERLTVPSELRRWLSLCSLRLTAVKTTTWDLKQAKRLRGAIWRVANAVLDEVTPSAADVRVINDMACRPGLVRALDRHAKSTRWRRPMVRLAMATIAQDAVVLFGDEGQRARLRRCENPVCRSVFYDDSRPGRRRWCASNRCGDRMRARLYRQRQRA
jgi:predicted RNA-binding Zn ribbon-like protein